MLRRGLLLDRDGVINIDRLYVGKREQFEFTPGLFPFLRAAQDMGLRLAILTNQSGVARGFYTEEDFRVLTAWMLKELGREGITIDLVLACFEHGEGSATEYRRESFWRKPSPGMVLEAIQKLRLVPARSVFLGDNLYDMEAAKGGGIVTRLLIGKPDLVPPEGAIAVKDFSEALERLKTIASA